jgi:anti-sigma-K factor RskA
MSGRHEELAGLIGPYVLGAVSDEERELIRSHLMSCEDCMRDADAFEQVSSSLALAVEPEPLPRGFADRVLQQVSAERGAPAGPPRPAWRRWLGGRPAIYAALALLVVLLGAGLLDARRDQNRTELVLQALLRQRGMGLRGESGALGRMIPTSEGGLFVVAGLKPTPEGRVYQLWLLARDCASCPPTSAGTFDVSDGVATVETERALDDVGGVAVTLEPDGGSPEPTSRPVISSG